MSGYKASSGNAVLDQLASRGGMTSLLDTVWLIITELAFGGVVERAGILNRLVSPVIQMARSTRALAVSRVAAVPRQGRWRRSPGAAAYTASPTRCG
jgi:NhaC family Na+:H+ antiporter